MTCADRTAPPSDTGAEKQTEKPLDLHSALEPSDFKPVTPLAQGQNSMHDGTIDLGKDCPFKNLKSEDVNYSAASLYKATGGSITRDGKIPERSLYAY